MPQLPTKATSSVIVKFERQISGREAIITVKGFTLFSLNEDMDDIIRIKKSLENSVLLIDGATETAKHKIKIIEGGVFTALIAPMAASLIVPMTSSSIQPTASFNGRRYLCKRG